MAIIGAAIAAAVGLPAIAGTLINIGIAVGLSFVSRALSGAATATAETGVKTLSNSGATKSVAKNQKVPLAGRTMEVYLRVSSIQRQRLPLPMWRQ